MEKLAAVARFAGTTIERVLFRWPARRAVAYSRLMAGLRRAGERELWRITPPRSGLESRV
ncbi:MAG: hypothetical protein A2Y64_09395 [Candidatus Coatesbacteria bacterium RBG_13_66_14]|uniref:Uncharacterized protein n=1 Tax=Candidatus Coatesbacteria bacterium RBG_13_66_14 TaxID=1817816 RepID=A0A1F5FFP5_9BACT|nr:MAG: hypothetical protein A2Y64_09395 [Candidatus Coatesbacteria bacterium RBG_13_66_14]